MNRLGMILAAAGLVAMPPAAHSAPAEAPPAFAWPFNGPNTLRMTAAFDLDPATTARADWTGWRTGEFGVSGHSYDGHSGTDWGMVTGTPLYAVANGTVFALRESVPNDDHSDTGNYLILNHNGIGGKNYRSRYWHLAQNGVVPSGTGVTVTKGQYVADSDNTGNSTGPHLHYSISLLSTDYQTCPFYNGWWENDEFYYGTSYPCLVYVDSGSGVLNCREGNSTGYSIITTIPAGTQLVATQRGPSGASWWRVMLPLPPSRAYESRTASGALAAGYSESGSWLNDSPRSAVSDATDDPNRVTLVAAGARSSSFGVSGDPADAATFTFTAPNQRGNYDIYATWPSSANAARVTYRITDSNGTTDILVDQKPAPVSAGTGAKASPYAIASNPYVANHTTVGAPDEWNAYSPVGAGLPEEGPENLYRFDLRTTSTVTVTVAHTGYPTKDIDIHLLTAAAPNTCIQRADWTFTASSLAPGTYYIACDSYGAGAAGNNAATNYTLTVTFSETEPFPNSWVRLGTFFFDRNAAGSVQVREDSVTGRVDPAQSAKVVADAIKVVPRITRRSGWVSDTIATRINTSMTTVSSVVIKTDKRADNDSDIIDDYVEVPVYASPAAGTVNTSAIVAKVVTGQRFVCTGRAGDWYKIMLTGAADAATGWILGDHLIGYRTDIVAGVDDWTLY
ncbi:MAG: peptidoglycan DD-metalloendopeptidase family protein [Candidatus Sumerlaeaceae bacterium]|nr:peptidoglycan DD-metalloendopeptidase family protein [Candidatus Sumerlaeaceae bacterium]